MSKLLTFEKVSKTFNDTAALKEVTFQLPENKIIGLIGANGAGKTTAMRLIVRHLYPDNGRVNFKGVLIEEYYDEVFPIAYIPDVPVYYEELTIAEHLAFIGAMYDTQSMIAHLVKRLELSDHLNKVPSVLSKGTKQKLSIACAFLRDSEVLLADEPFSGLDPRQIKMFKDMLIESKMNGKTIILSTHLLDVIESICDEYVMLDHGKVIAQGTFDEIVNNNQKCATLEELYLYLTAGEDDTSDEYLDERSEKARDD